MITSKKAIIPEDYYYLDVLTTLDDFDQNIFSGEIMLYDLTIDKLKPLLTSNYFVSKNHAFPFCSLFIFNTRNNGIRFFGMDITSFYNADLDWMLILFGIGLCVSNTVYSMKYGYIQMSNTTSAILNLN